MGRIVEANAEVPAADLRFFGGVKAPYLLWYDTPAPGAKIWVTVGIVVSLRAPPGLEAIRIVLPEGVSHGIRTTARGNTDDGATFVTQLISARLNPPGTFSSYTQWIARDITAGAGAVNSSIGDVPLEPDRRRWIDLGRSSEVEVRFA